MAVINYKYNDKIQLSPFYLNFYIFFDKIIIVKRKERIKMLNIVLFFILMVFIYYNFYDFFDS